MTWDKFKEDLDALNELVGLNFEEIRNKSSNDFQNKDYYIDLIKDWLDIDLLKPGNEKKIIFTPNGEIIFEFDKLSLIKDDYEIIFYSRKHNFDELIKKLKYEFWKYWLKNYYFNKILNQINAISERIYHDKIDLFWDAQHNKVVLEFFNNGIKYYSCYHHWPESFVEELKEKLGINKWH